MQQDANLQGNVHFLIEECASTAGRRLHVAGIGELQEGHTERGPVLDGDHAHPELEHARLAENIELG